MQKPTALIQILLLSWLLALPAWPQSSAAELKRKLSQAVESRSALDGAEVGIYVKVLKTGRVLYSLNGTTPMIPASNLKIVTTATALDMLGPDFRYTTELLGPRPDASGVIKGDMVLRGSGDPTFCYPYNNPPTEPLRFFVRQMREQGIRHIEGGVVADDSAFDREFLGRGWYDRYLLDSYAAPVGALSLNANLVGLSISSKGVVLEPNSPTLEIVNQVKAGGYTELWVDRKRGDDTIYIKGTIAPGDVVKRQVTVNNPTLFTAGAFLDILQKGGISISGGVKVGPPGNRPEIAGLKRYARYQSPRLLELIAQVNRESDNLFAQHLFKTIGEHTNGYGTAESAEAAVVRFLGRHYVDTTGLKMVDGSGLSELNRISPRQLVDTLAVMWDGDHGQRFIDSLPAGGEGTLSYRLNGLVVRAKTGTLKGHSGLSGYVVSSYGQTIAFSVLVNNVGSTWSAIELEDHVVRILASWPEPL